MGLTTAKSSFSFPLTLQGRSAVLLSGCKQIAKLIKKDKAHRAVGKANGDNYMAILVPCHRVVEANGNLRGYGGGLRRKEYLLELERRKY